MRIIFTDHIGSWLAANILMHGAVEAANEWRPGYRAGSRGPRVARDRREFGLLLAHCGLLPDDDRVTRIRHGQGGGIAMHMPAHTATGSPDITIPDRGGDRSVCPGRDRANPGVDEGCVLGAGVYRLR